MAFGVRLWPTNSHKSTPNLLPTLTLAPHKHTKPAAVSSAPYRNLHYLQQLQEQRQQHPIRTKLLRGRGLVAQVLPIEMQTLWYGNWQLQKPARIHTSIALKPFAQCEMRWHFLPRDNTDKWTQPASLGRVRERERRDGGEGRERVESRRKRRVRGNGGKGQQKICAPLHLSIHRLGFETKKKISSKCNTCINQSDFSHLTSFLDHLTPSSSSSSSTKNNWRPCQQHTSTYNIIPAWETFFFLSLSSPPKWLKTSLPLICV